MLRRSTIPGTQTRRRNRGGVEWYAAGKYGVLLSGWVPRGNNAQMPTVVVTLRLTLGSCILLSRRSEGPEGYGSGLRIRFLDQFLAYSFGCCGCGCSGSCLCAVIVFSRLIAQAYLELSSSEMMLTQPGPRDTVQNTRSFYSLELSHYDVFACLTTSLNMASSKSVRRTLAGRSNSLGR